jgi:hypothetical protein
MGVRIDGIHPMFLSRDIEAFFDDKFTLVELKRTIYSYLKKKKN